MSMLAAPDTITGPLTAADLDAARKHSTGTVLHRATVCPPCTSQCNQGRACPAESCATEGGEARDPVESMIRYRQTAATVRYGFALAVLLAVCGYLARVIWPN